MATGGIGARSPTKRDPNSCLEQALWAQGLVVSSTGLTAEQRDSVRAAVQAGGGRYCPELSRHCTHLLAPEHPALSRKLQLVHTNRNKWSTIALTAAWPSACAAAGVRLAEADFAVDLEALVINQSHQQPICKDAPAEGVQSDTHGSGRQPLASVPALSDGASCAHGAAPRMRAALPLQPRRSKRTSARAMADHADRAAASPLRLGGDSLRRLAIANKAAHSRRQSGVRGLQLRSAAVRPTVAVQGADKNASSRRSKASKARLSPAQAAALLRKAEALARDYDQDAAQPLPQPPVRAQQRASQPSEVAETGLSDRLRQRPFLLSHARIHKEDAHTWTALPGAARSSSPAGGSAAFADASFQRDPASRLEPALPPTACRRQPAPATAVSDSNTRDDGSCSGVTAACARATERKHGAGVPPPSGAPALVAELRRLASLRRMQGAQTAARGAAGAVPTAVPDGSASAAIQRTDQTSSAARQQAQCGQPAKLRSVEGRNVEGKDAGAPSGTLASELRALRARPSRGRELEPAIVLRQSPVRKESLICRAAVAAQAMRDATDRASPLNGAAPARDAGCLAMRIPARSAGCHPRPAAVQMSADATAQTASAQPAGQQPTPNLVFDGIRAVFDPSLEASQAARARAALLLGGGEEVAGAYLGCDTTHVICNPANASHWLSMGVNVVSPQWVLRSAKQGSLQRVVAMSLDASRRLPADGAAQQGRAAAASAAKETRQSADGAATTAEAGTNRAERETLLAGLLQKQLQCEPAAASGSGSVRWGPTPGCLLQDLLWSVTEPVEAARLDTRRTADADNVSPRCPDAGADQEARDDQPPPCDVMLSMSQLEVANICSGAGRELHAAVPGRDPHLAASAGFELRSEEWDEIVYRGPSMTVLYPADARAGGAHLSHLVPVSPRGLSRRGLLTAMRGYYEAPLTTEEQLQLMAGGSTAAEAVKEAFLDGQPLLRGALLGGRRALEGLYKAPRDSHATIYQLRLLG